MATTTQLALLKDINQNVTYGLPVSNTKYRAILAAGVAGSLVVPPNADCAFFSYTSGSNVWVDYAATATGPASTTFTATTSELNPVARKVVGGSTISFYSDDIANVSAVFFNTTGTGLI